MSTTTVRGHRAFYRNEQRRAAYQAAQRPRGDEHLLSMAMAGLIVAEALPTHVREWLVHDLHKDGWTDLEIADHTRMTLYTTARIRGRLGLRPNRPRAEGIAA